MKPDEGQNIVVNITSVNSRGEGVARFGEDRFVLFAAGALPGEKIKGRVKKIKKSYGILEIEEIIEKSPDRRVPSCRWFERCGGCSLQHADYELQCFLKKRALQDALMKELGSGCDYIVDDCVKSPDEWHYRNKASFPVRFDDKKSQYGFFMRDSHRVIPVDFCPVLQNPLEEAMKNIPKILEILKWPAYDEKKHLGVLRHIVLRATKSGNVSFVFVVRSFRQKDEQKKLRDLRSFLNSRGYRSFPSVFVNVNKKRGNQIFGLRTFHIAGPAFIEERIGNHILRFGPTSFFQVNPLITEKVFETAISGFKTGGRVVELYSGVGAMTLPLVGKSSFVHAVESWPEAANFLKENLFRSGFTNASVEGTTAEDFLERVDKDYCEGILLDPPRSGCSRKVIDKLLFLRPERIVYVSCNPATLARDLKNLVGDGYKITRITPFDMFPQTTHVESVAFLEKNKTDIYRIPAFPVHK